MKFIKLSLDSIYKQIIIIIVVVELYTPSYNRLLYTVQMYQYYHKERIVISYFSYTLTF
jgi:hypothetical protein